jgi:hypothetical protein
VKDKNAKKIDLTPSFLRKVIKICIVFAVFLLVVLLLLNFLASRFINKESIREKIQTTVSEKIGGEVEFDRADLSIFPLTHVVMHQGRFSIPEKAAGSFDSVSIRPKILYLLIGKVRIAKISVTAPDISIKLPERSPQKAKVRDKGEKDKDDPLAVLKEHLFSLLAPLSLPVSGYRCPCCFSAERTEVKPNLQFQPLGEHFNRDRFGSKGLQGKWFHQPVKLPAEKTSGLFFSET